MPPICTACQTPWTRDMLIQLERILNRRAFKRQKVMVAIICDHCHQRLSSTIEVEETRHAQESPADSHDEPGSLL